MDNWKTPFMAALAFVAGFSASSIYHHAKSQPVKQTETQLYPIMSTKFFANKGEQKTVQYSPGGMAASQTYRIQFNGTMNQDGYLEFNINDNVYPTKLNHPIELNTHKTTKQKVELTPLEIIAKGEEKEAIIHLELSGPQIN